MDKTTIKKLAERALWTRETFALLICGYDPDNPMKDNLPESYYIEVNRARDRIREAAIAGQLKYISEPDSKKSYQAYGTDMLFKPIDAISWARSRKTLFPNFPNFPILVDGTAIGMPNDSTKNLLENSLSWQAFKRQAERAIAEFPKWKDEQGRRSAWGSEQTEWLKDKIGLNTKELEVVKKILRDCFDK